MQLLLRSVQLWCILLLGDLLALRGYAQAPAWETALVLATQGIPGANPPNNSVIVRATAPDGQGNLYVAGSFTNTATFGATTLVSTPVAANQSTNYSADLFVAKWSLSANRYLWAIRASSAGTEAVSQLVVSGTSVYLAGTTYRQSYQPSGLQFGTETSTLPTTVGHNIFVAKLLDAGTSANWKWSKIGNCEYLANVAGLGVSGTAVYLAGDVAGTMTFDDKSVKSIQTQAYNAPDLLLVKFTDAGTSALVNWVQLTGSPTYEYANAFAVNGTSLYLGASYTNSSTIGTISMPNTGPNSTSDGFVTKFTDRGTAAAIVWTQHIGSTGGDLVSNLVADGSALYVAGSFNGPSLGLGIPVTATLTNQDAGANTADLFLAKLIDAGTSSNFAWAQQVGGAGSEYVDHLLRTGSTFYLAGTFHGATATLGRTVLTNTTAAGGQDDLYVARLEETSTGATVTWAQQAGSVATDNVNSLHLVNNRLYLAGYVEEAAIFGTLTAPAASSYLAILSPNAPLAATTFTTLPGLVVYPNPAHSSIIVQLPAAVSGSGPMRLTLRDALGRVAATHTVTGVTQEVDLSSLPNGVYLLQVQVGDARTTRRLIVN